MQEHTATDVAKSKSPRQPSAHRVFGAAPSTHPHWKRTWSPRSSAKSEGSRQGSDAHSPRSPRSSATTRLTPSGYESKFFKSLFVKAAAAADASNDFIDGFASAFASHDREIEAVLTDTFSSAAASQASAPLGETITPLAGTQRQAPSSDFAVGSSFNDFDEGEMTLGDDGGGARVQKRECLWTVCLL